MMLKHLFVIFAVLLTAGAAAADNVLTIGDVQLSPGESADIPVIITSATNVAAGQTDIEYDPAVISIDSMEEGDLDWTMFNLEASATSVRIVILSLGDGMSGDVVMATMHVTAIGGIGENSTLRTFDAAFCEPNVIEIPFVTSDGSVTIVPPNEYPIIDEVRTMDFAPGGTGMIGVRAHDSDGEIASVEFDLSVFGLGVVPASHVYGDDYDLEFQMPINIRPGAYYVDAIVTDDDGAVSSVPIEIVVVSLMGDVNGDGIVSSLDALLLCQYIVSPNGVGINLGAADVVPDGRINVLDAKTILNIATGNTCE